MYISINGKFLDKHRAEAKATSIANIGEEDQKDEDSLTWEDLNATVEDMEINENDISFSATTDLGYFSIEIPIDSDFVEQILDLTIKKMNKIKTMIQSLK